MKDSKNTSAKPPTTEPWVKLPRKLLASDAWRSMSINGRRLLDFLMLEHMRHGGRKNGALMAPYDQLVEFGIGRRFVSSAVDELDILGLIDCRRGRRRLASIYSLTWLPLQGDVAPSNRWEVYRNPDIAAPEGKQSQVLVHKGELKVVHEGELKGGVLVHKGELKTPDSLVHEGELPSRKILTRAEVTNNSSRRPAAAGARVSNLPWSEPTFVEIECPQPRAKRWVQ